MIISSTLPLIVLLSAVAHSETPSPRRILGERNALLGATHREVVALSRDGERALLLEEDGRVELLDPVTRRVLSTHQPPLEATTIQFLGKERLIGWGKDGRVASWDADTGGSSLTLRHSGKEFRQPVSSHDGGRIAFVEDQGVVAVIDANTGVRVASLGRASDDFYRQPMELALSADGRLAASGDWEGSVIVWNVDAAAVVWSTRAFSGRQEMVSRGVAGPHYGFPDSAVSLAFSPNGRVLAAGGRKGELFLFDAQSGRTVRADRAEESAPYPLLFHPDGRSLIAGGRAGSLRRLRVFGRDDVFSVKGRTDITQLAISTDGLRLVALEKDGMVVARDARDGRTPGPARTRTVWRAEYSGDGRFLAAGGDDGVVELFSMPGGERLRSIKAHAGAVTLLSFSPDGSLLATVGYSETLLIKDLRVWDAVSGKKIWGEHVKGVSFGERFAFAPNGRTLIIGDDKDLVVWDARSGKRLRVFARHPKSVDDIAVSPDGRYVATGCDDARIRLWSMASGKPLFEVPVDASQYSWTKDISFTPDGKQVVGWDRNARRHYRLAVPSGRVLEAVKLDKTARAVLLSSDGRLAVSQDDNTLGKWTAYMLGSRGDRKQLFENLRGVGTMVALSPDGRDLVTAGDDGFLRVWSVPP